MQRAARMMESANRAGTLISLDQRAGFSVLVELHDERDFDIVLIPVSLGLTGWVGERSIEGALYCVSQTAWIDCTSPYIANRPVWVDSGQNRTLHTIYARLVHVANRWGVRSARLRQ